MTLGVECITVSREQKEKSYSLNSLKETFLLVLFIKFKVLFHFSKMSWMIHSVSQ